MALLSDPLVSTDWLAANLGSVRPVDGTWSMPNDVANLPSGYIPGSVVFDIDAVADQGSDMAHMLPSAAVFSAAIGAMGITPEDTIVIYDRHGVFSSPRVWWTLKMFGHENVYVLDGGLPAWIAAQHRMDDKPASYAPTAYAAATPLAKIASLDDVLIAIGVEAQIVDARPPGRFTGSAPEPRAGLRSGRMPDAVNVPFSSLRTTNSHFKPLDELATQFAELDLAKPIITTCGSGITAAGLAFTLARLGAADVRVYDGSWTEYGARGDVPIEKD